MKDSLVGGEIHASGLRGSGLSLPRKCLLNLHVVRLPIIILRELRQFEHSHSWGGGEVDEEGVL